MYFSMYVYEKKCSARRMERPTDGRAGRQGHRKVSLSIRQATELATLQGYITTFNDKGIFTYWMRIDLRRGGGNTVVIIDMLLIYEKVLCKVHYAIVW